MLFSSLLNPPWSRANRQHAAMQLARRITHNCSFLRLIQVDGTPCAVLRSGVLSTVSAESMRLVLDEQVVVQVGAIAIVVDPVVDAVVCALGLLSL